MLWNADCAAKILPGSGKDQLTPVFRYQINTNHRYDHGIDRHGRYWFPEDEMTQENSDNGVDIRVNRYFLCRKITHSIYEKAIAENGSGDDEI